MLKRKSLTIANKHIFFQYVQPGYIYRFGYYFTYNDVNRIADQYGVKIKRAIYSNSFNVVSISKPEPNEHNQVLFDPKMLVLN